MTFSILIASVSHLAENPHYCTEHDDYPVIILLLEGYPYSGSKVLDEDGSFWLLVVIVVLAFFWHGTNTL